MAINFIDPNSPVAAVLDGILSAAGPNFSAPYDAGTQQHNIIAANNDALINFQMPAGASFQGHQDPGVGRSIGASINNMLGLLAPAISAYALILPILGVIRGIIEVICALINPFAFIRAVKRLFKKWLPPFLSLFPAIAGIIIILSTIKAILAIIFYIMTEVIPAIQLIIDNIKGLELLFQNQGDFNTAQEDATKEKTKKVG